MWTIGSSLGACPYRILRLTVVVVRSTKDWHAEDGAIPSDRLMAWRNDGCGRTVVSIGRQEAAQVRFAPDPTWSRHSRRI